MRNRLITTTFMALVMVLVASGPALAHHCVNANKASGAGSVGIVNVGDLRAFDESKITFTPLKEPNAQGKDRGAFVTLEGIGLDGKAFSYDSFTRRTLPEMAMMAGPGDSMCDGKGIDEVLSCLGFQ